MAKLLWAVVAQRAIVDSSTNNASLVDVLEELSLPEPPVAPEKKKDRLIVPLRFALVALWRRSDLNRAESFDMSVTLVGPKAEKIAELKSRVDLRNHVRMRSNVQFPGLPLFGPGSYRLIVKQRDGSSWRRVSEQFIEVKHLKVGAQQGRPPLAQQVKARPLRRRVH
jgi:hypothetical protein